MKVIFAKNIGFCSGVKRAMEIAKISLKKDSEPVQFLGNLVHNEKVIENLKRKGGKIISDLDQVKSGTLIIKAHGVSPALEKRLQPTHRPPASAGPIPKSVLIRDATCPLVKKAQLKARDLSEAGYQVIIIGDRNHPETEGIKGYAKNRAVIIENKSQAKKLPKFRKIGVVSQTTQNLDKVNQILKILKNKAKEFKWVNTVCPEVLVRQKELSEILKKADGILVIGSPTSANTTRLIGIVKESKKPVWWINALEDLKKQKLTNISTLGVVSGTSTPDWEIKKIKKWLKDAKQK
jgi:4-hydroxy-3-methylbut-2-enyl diphosphate reductase